MGPGKADLLDALEDTGSISAAARRTGLSYRKAWMLIDELNRAFRDPLVSTAFGGAGGGGARLTPTGATVLAAYRRLEQAAVQAGADEIALIQSLVAEEPAPAAVAPPSGDESA
nr:LysR family transcriptional regulator [Rhodospirillum rubrum]